MPSFISNSDTRMTAKNWGRIWLAAFLVVVVVMGAWEFYWRGKGFFPSVNDDLNLWSLTRSKISPKTKVAFAGSSRIQMGLHPDVFKQKLGIVPVNLSVDGNPPYPVIYDLAGDVSFKGTLIVSFTPRWLGESDPKKSRASKWVRKHKKKTLLSKVDTYLAVAVQKTFAFRYSGLSISKIRSKLERGLAPIPTYAPLRFDRYRQGLFTPENTPRILAARTKRERMFAKKARPVTEKGFEERIEALNKAIAKIRKRGGDVLFLRLPTSGPMLEIETALWPRQKYWGVFEKKISAKIIHFADHDSLKSFTCPDGSHMGLEDARRYTERLLEMIKL